MRPEIHFMCPPIFTGISILLLNFSDDDDDDGGDDDDGVTLCLL